MGVITSFTKNTKVQIDVCIKKLRKKFNTIWYVLYFKRIICVTDGPFTYKLLTYFRVHYFIFRVWNPTDQGLRWG